MQHVEALKTLKPKENKKRESIEGFFPKDIKTNKLKNEVYEVKKWEEKIKRKGLIYKEKNINITLNNLKQ